MSFKPEIHFDYLHHHKWVGKPLKDLYTEMEELRIKVKEAVGYNWDNQHFFLNDIFGHSALKVLFSPGDVSFWNAHNNSYVGIITQMTKAEVKNIDEWIAMISKGLTQCSECGKLVSEFISYSFTGAVCKDCYNPSKHLPPDTRD